MKLKQLALAGAGGVAGSVLGGLALRQMSKSGPPSQTSAYLTMIGVPLVGGWFLGRRRGVVGDLGRGMAVQGATAAGLAIFQRIQAARS